MPPSTQITPHGVTANRMVSSPGPLFFLSAPPGCGYMVTLMTVGEGQLAY